MLGFRFVAPEVVGSIPTNRTILLPSILSIPSSAWTRCACAP